jgi:hypothetical protein
MKKPIRSGWIMASIAEMFQQCCRLIAVQIFNIGEGSRMTMREFATRHFDGMRNVPGKKRGGWKSNPLLLVVVLIA